MTTDELNAIVQAVMQELEKAGVDFDFKAETPQPTDLVYVMRGTADKYQGITVKWQNLLDIIVQKATEARDDAISAKDIALQTLATIQGIESNVSTMKTSVETMKTSVETAKSQVETMKASVEASEANVTQMKASVEATKSDVEGMKSDVTNLKAQTQTIVDNAKEDVTGLLDTKADATYVDGELAKKVNYSDSLTYEQIMASTDLTNKVASASSVNDISKVKEYNVPAGDNVLIFRKVGKVVSVYANFKNLDTSTQYEFTIPSELSPKYNYAIFPILSKSSPFNTIGTIWFRSDTKLLIYKPSNLTAFYVFGTYVIKE